MTTTDVLVVGGGLEGRAAAWALIRRGVTDVTIVERDTVGSGGTGKSTTAAAFADEQLDVPQVLRGEQQRTATIRRGRKCRT